MTKRRGKGEGSIYRRKDGLWVAQYIAGDKRRYIYGRSRKDRAREFRSALNKLEQEEYRASFPDNPT